MAGDFANPAEDEKQTIAQNKRRPRILTREEKKRDEDAKVDDQVEPENEMEKVVSLTEPSSRFTINLSNPSWKNS